MERGNCNAADVCVRIKNLRTNPPIGKTLSVNGWVRSARAQKNFTFIELSDGSTVAGLQVVIDESIPGYQDIVPQLTVGTALCATGTLVESPGAKQPFELKGEAIEIIGACPAESYPLQKKRHSFEFLRTIAHLRPRTNTQGAVARVRSRLAFAIHLFFQERGFLYLQSPIITGADCEGAGELFQVTTLPLDKIPKTLSGQIDYAEDFFGKAAYLTVSGQLNGEAFACALRDIYTFGPTFRAENSNTARHLAEFWMVEPEMAFTDLEGNRECAESFLKYLLEDLFTHCSEELAFFDAFIEKGLIHKLQHVLAAPFARLTYTEAVEILLASKHHFTYPVKWGCDLQSEHERYLAEEYCKKPLILSDYPRELKAFYMRDNADGKTVAAMDVLVPQIGEIIGGAQREERLELLEKKMLERHMDLEPYSWYLDLRRYGTVPHSGFGLGFERLIRFVTGMENIRDVNAFPRAPKQADF